MQSTAPFAVITYTQDDTGTSNPTVDNYLSMAGAVPTLVRNADGDVSITWDAAYFDPYSVSGTIHIRHAIATTHGTGSNFATGELLDLDVNTFNEVVRVRCFTDAGAAATDLTVTLTIYTSGTV